MEESAVAENQVGKDLKAGEPHQDSNKKDKNTQDSGAVTDQAPPQTQSTSHDNSSATGSTAATFAVVTPVPQSSTTAAVATTSGKIQVNLIKKPEETFTSDIVGKKRPLTSEDEQDSGTSKKIATETIMDPSTFGGIAPGTVINGAQPSAVERTTVLVPRDTVGFVIGKGGETIRQLIAESGAHIEVDRLDPDPTTPHRIFNVTGTPAQIEKAKMKIQEKVAGMAQNLAAGAAQIQNPPEGAITIELWVPLDKVGMVIGSGGQVIKQLQENSRATIVVHNDKVNAQNEKLITIVGGPAEANLARNMVTEISNRPRPENSLQQGMAMPNIYGMPVGGMQKTVYVPNSCVGIVIGKGGEQIHELQRRTGAHIKVTPDRETPKNAQERAIMISGPPGAIEQAHNALNDLVNECLRRQATGQVPGFGFVYPAQSITVTLKVPNDKVGLVIGKSGQTIRDLQNRSMARIVVGKENETNTEDNTRPITVSGPPNCVELAKALINEKVTGTVFPAYSAYAAQAATQYGGYPSGPGAPAASYPNPGYDASQSAPPYGQFDPSQQFRDSGNDQVRAAQAAQAAQAMYYQYYGGYGYPTGVQPDMAKSAGVPQQPNGHHNPAPGGSR